MAWASLEVSVVVVMIFTTVCTDGRNASGRLAAKNCTSTWRESSAVCLFTQDSSGLLQMPARSATKPMY